MNVATMAKPSLIRSFVIRGGRLTPSQKRALADLSARYGASPESLRKPQTLFAIPPASLSLEIGFGNGENLLAMAKQQPAHGFIGIEVYPPGLGRMLTACAQYQLTNVRIVQADAATALHYLPDGSLARVVILFPDPWPKRRHHKRRLLKTGFLSTIAKKLKPAGSLYIASDCYAYIEEIIDNAKPITKLSNDSASEVFSAPPAWYQAGKFARRALETIYHLHYRRAK